LVLDEHGFGHHGTGAAGTGEPGDCHQQMQKEDGEIAHRSILARSRSAQQMLANFGIRHRRVLAALADGSAPVTPATSIVGKAPKPWVSTPRARSVPRNSGPRVVGLHFVCRGALNIRDLPDGTFESGVWVVADQHARTAEYVALHESRSMPSYRQGRILGYRLVVHEGRTRLIFHVQPGPKTLPWVGEGSGEKGYCYG
jgi:hypothetical protein